MILQKKIISSKSFTGTWRVVALRTLSFFISKSKDWNSIPTNEKLALELLGWNKDNWSGNSSLPVSATENWKNLSSAQQSAVKYGLQMTEEQWNKSIQSQIDSNNVPKDHPTNKQSTAVVNHKNQSSFASIALKSVWSGIKVIAPLVSLASYSSNIHPILKLSALAIEKMPTLVEAASSPIVIEDVETIVYLDDSESMNFMGKLSRGKEILQEMMPMLQRNTRVVKFGKHKTILSPREDKLSSSISIFGWNGRSGGTYMWKMIEDDVKERYKPPVVKTSKGNGKLRIVLITDGEDCLSPSEYTGMKGMDPMMKALLREGYDIEWYIVIIEDGVLSALSGSSGRSGAARYEALAKATGGSYFVTSTLTDPIFHTGKKNVSAFYQALASSSEKNDASERLRLDRRQQYYKEAEEGKVHLLDWVKHLPKP